MRETQSYDEYKFPYYDEYNKQYPDDLDNLPGRAQIKKYQINDGLEQLRNAGISFDTIYYLKDKDNGQKLKEIIITNSPGVVRLQENGMNFSDICTSGAHHIIDLMAALKNPDAMIQLSKIGVSFSTYADVKADGRLGNLFLDLPMYPLSTANAVANIQPSTPLSQKNEIQSRPLSIRNDEEFLYYNDYIRAYTDDTYISNNEWDKRRVDYRLKQLQDAGMNFDEIHSFQGLDSNGSPENYIIKYDDAVANIQPSTPLSQKNEIKSRLWSITNDEEFLYYNDYIRKYPDDTYISNNGSDKRRIDYSLKQLQDAGINFDEIHSFQGLDSNGYPENHIIKYADAVVNLQEQFGLEFSELCKLKDNADAKHILSNYPEIVELEAHGIMFPEIYKLKDHPAKGLIKFVLQNHEKFIYLEKNGQPFSQVINTPGLHNIIRNYPDPGDYLNGSDNPYLRQVVRRRLNRTLRSNVDNPLTAYRICRNDSPVINSSNVARITDPDARAFFESKTTKLGMLSKLPADLRHTLYGYMSQKDLGRFRRVNKQAFNEGKYLDYVEARKNANVMGNIVLK